MNAKRSSTFRRARTRKNRPKWKHDTPCLNCGKQLRPSWDITFQRIDKGHDELYHGVTHLGYDYNNLFCTKRCGYDYGVKIARLALLKSNRDPDEREDLIEEYNNKHFPLLEEKDV